MLPVLRLGKCLQRVKSIRNKLQQYGMQTTFQYSNLVVTNTTLRRLEVLQKRLLVQVELVHLRMVLMLEEKSLTQYREWLTSKRLNLLSRFAIYSVDVEKIQVDQVNGEVVLVKKWLLYRIRPPMEESITFSLEKDQNFR